MRCLRHSTFLILALTIASAGAFAQPDPSPGDATFLVFVRGHQVGLERISLARTAAGWEFKGSGRLAAPFDLTTRNYEMRYGPDWQPIDFVLAATYRGQPVSLTTSFSLTMAISEINEGGQRSVKTDEISARAAVLPANFFAAYEALAVRLAGATEGATLRAYLATQADVAVQVRRVSEQKIQTPGGAVAIKRYAITLHRPESPLEIDVWVDGRQRLARLDIPSASIVVSRQDISSVMARAETHHNPGDENVTMPAQGFTLAGTITRPTTAAGPWPAVVLVGSSGVQDRDEATARVPIFGQLAGSLADAGILALRYDKRGIGQSGGRAEAATLDDYAEDLRAVVRFLRERKDINRNRIVVAGYADGGWTALQAAAKDDDIRGLVLLAAIGLSGADYTREQQRRELERLGLSDTERQARIELQERIITAAGTGAGWETVPPEIRTQAETAWFRSFLSFDPARVMTKVEQPVLVLSAERDTEVPANHAERLEGAARGRKKARPTEAVRLAGLNHLLVPAKTGLADEYPELADQPVSPEVAKAIANWMAAAVTLRK